MKQSAAERPDPTTQRKAAIARGAALEHNGKVRVEPIPNFDLNRTIFKTLEGSAPRFVMNTRVGIEAHWDAAAAQAVQAEYDATAAAHQLPPISPALMQFLVNECDFDVEHADGSFLDHLYFCFEYIVGVPSSQVEEGTSTQLQVFAGVVMGGGVVSTGVVEGLHPVPSAISVVSPINSCPVKTCSRIVHPLGGEKGVEDKTDARCALEDWRACPVRRSTSSSRPAPSFALT